MKNCGIWEDSVNPPLFMDFIFVKSAYLLKFICNRKVDTYGAYAIFRLVQNSKKLELLIVHIPSK